MPSWAKEEVRYADLGDRRLNKRLLRLVEDLAAQPTASVPQACQTKAATKAAYLFLNSPRVTPQAIRQAHPKSTVARRHGHQIIMAIQDTTALDFTSHPHTAGRGPLDHPAHQGLKVPSTLAVSPEGVPLRLIPPGSVGTGSRSRGKASSATAA